MIYKLQKYTTTTTTTITTKKLSSSLVSSSSSLVLSSLLFCFFSPVRILLSCSLSSLLSFPLVSSVFLVFLCCLGHAPCLVCRVLPVSSDSIPQELALSPAVDAGRASVVPAPGAAESQAAALRSRSRSRSRSGRDAAPKPAYELRLPHGHPSSGCAGLYVLNGTFHERPACLPPPPLKLSLRHSEPGNRFSRKQSLYLRGTEAWRRQRLGGTSIKRGTGCTGTMPGMELRTRGGGSRRSVGRSRSSASRAQGRRRRPARAGVSSR